MLASDWSRETRQSVSPQPASSPTRSDAPGGAVGVGRFFRFSWVGFERSAASELLDGSDHDPRELAANLHDIRLVNRFFGGVGVVLRYLPATTCSVPADQPLRILDLATGSGDIPRAVVAWGKRNGRTLHVTASDASAEILAIAASQLTGYPEISLSRYDARAVPLPDASFDVVLCSLALHHFDPHDAIAVLKEMDRLAIHGFILNDLVRSRRGFVVTWLAARLTTRNRLTRHDAPLSIRRAYTPAELRALLSQAVIGDVTIHRHPWFRMAAVKTKQSAVSRQPSAIRRQ